MVPEQRPPAGISRHQGPGHLHAERAGEVVVAGARVAEAGVNIKVLYSDHDGPLVLVVDDAAGGGAVSAAWERERTARTSAA